MSIEYYIKYNKKKLPVERKTYILKFNFKIEFKIITWLHVSALYRPSSGRRT
jgi:hypothetical protein